LHRIGSDRVETGLEWSGRQGAQGGEAERRKAGGGFLRSLLSLRTLAAHTRPSAGRPRRGAGEAPFIAWVIARSWGLGDTSQGRRSLPGTFPAVGTRGHSPATTRGGSGFGSVWPRRRAHPETVCARNSTVGTNLSFWGLGQDGIWEQRGPSG
jgi:hypothetical protein